MSKLKNEFKSVHQVKLTITLKYVNNSQISYLSEGRELAEVESIPLYNAHQDVCTRLQLPFFCI